MTPSVWKALQKIQTQTFDVLLPASGLLGQVLGRLSDHSRGPQRMRFFSRAGRR